MYALRTSLLAKQRSNKHGDTLAEYISNMTPAKPNQSVNWGGGELRKAQVDAPCLLAIPAFDSVTDT